MNHMHMHIMNHKYAHYEPFSFWGDDDLPGPWLRGWHRGGALEAWGPQPTDPQWAHPKSEDYRIPDRIPAVA